MQPSPMGAWRSFVGAERVLRVVQWMARKRSSPMTRSNLQHAVQVAGDVVAPSHTWQVSRHTPTFSSNSTASMMAASSSKRPPTSVPLPAMVSSSSVVDCSGVSTWFSVGDERDARLGALAHVAARVHVVQLAGGCFPYA